MLNKKDGTVDWFANIQWIIIIGLVILGIYNMGKNSNKKPTIDMSDCYKWYGKESCDNPNFNPE